jgi:hypothetical protein
MFRTGSKIRVAVAAERLGHMAVEIKESGPSEDEVESMLGKGKVKVKEARIEEGKFGSQIRLGLLHKKGIEFAAWVTPNRSKIEEVARCFGIAPPGRGESFDETDLVDKVGEVRIGSKTDSKGILRPKVDAWLPASVEAAKPVAAPAKTDDETGSGIPF